MIWHFCMILGSFIPNRVSQKYLPHSMATHSQSLYQYKPVCTTTLQCAQEIRETTYIGLLGNPSRRQRRTSSSSRQPPPPCGDRIKSISENDHILGHFPHFDSKIAVCQYLLSVARLDFCFFLFHTTD